MVLVNAFTLLEHDEKQHALFNLRTQDGGRGGNQIESTSLCLPHQMKFSSLETAGIENNCLHKKASKHT